MNRRVGIKSGNATPASDMPPRLRFRLQPVDAGESLEVLSAIPYQDRDLDNPTHPNSSSDCLNHYFRIGPYSLLTLIDGTTNDRQSQSFYCRQKAICKHFERPHRHRPTSVSITALVGQHTPQQHHSTGTTEQEAKLSGSE